MKPPCYIASPSGFAESTMFWYQEKFLPVVSQHVEVLDPWVAKVSHIFAAPEAERPNLWLNLGDFHYETIERKAHMVISILDQEPPDIGTCMEVAFAMGKGIPVIGYRNDMRSSGESGMPYNLMLGAAVRRSGGFPVSSLQELEERLPGFIADDLPLLRQKREQSQ